MENTYLWLLITNIYFIGNEGLIPVKKDSTQKVGFISPYGDVVIKPVCRNAWPFYEGMACAWNNEGKSGFIDYRGEWMIEPKFLGPLEFYEGVSSAYTDYQISEGKPLVGYTNLDGEWVIQPQFITGGVFSGGVAKVLCYDRDADIGLLGYPIVAGYINSAGDWIYKWTE